MKTGTRILLGLAGFFVGLVVICVLGMMFAVHYSKTSLERYRAELAERGEPLDVAAIAPPEAPKENNGAPALVSAAKELSEILRTTKAKRITLGQQENGGVAEVMHRAPTAQRNTTDVPWSEAAAALEPMQGALEGIRQAAQQPVLAIDLAYSKGVQMPMDPILGLLTAVQYLSMDALVRLQRGDTAGAVDDVAAELRIQRLTAEHPILIGQLIHCSLVALSQVSTWEILQAEAVTEDDLARLQRAWEESPTAPLFVPMLRMERAQAGPMFEAASATMRAMTGSGGWTGGSSGGVTTPTLTEIRDNLSFASWRVLFRYGDERQFMENYQSLIDETTPGQPVDWQRSLATMERIQKSLTEAGVGRLFSKTVIPALRTSVERFGATETLRELTITAIALRRYQLDHAGALPPTLETLVPQYLATVPRDPMDGDTLRYKPEAGGFLLYSVGLNGIDEGGDASQPPERKQKSILDRKDIVWPRLAPPSPTP